MRLIPLLVFLSIILNCSTDDDNDCPDELIVDINDSESLARAEECGLSPAEPLGEFFIYR